MFWTCFFLPSHRLAILSTATQTWYNCDKEGTPVFASLCMCIVLFSFFFSSSDIKKRIMKGPLHAPSLYEDVNAASNVWRKYISFDKLLKMSWNTFNFWCSRVSVWINFPVHTPQRSKKLWRRALLVFLSELSTNCLAIRESVGSILSCRDPDYAKMLTWKLRCLPLERF